MQLAQEAKKLDGKVGRIPGLESRATTKALKTRAAHARRPASGPGLLLYPLLGLHSGESRDPLVWILSKPELTVEQQKGAGGTRVSSWMHILLLSH